MYTWLSIDIVSKDNELKNRYFVPRDKYNEALDLILSCGGITYETYLNRKFYSCETTLFNNRITLEFETNYEEPRVDLDKNYASFVRKMKSITKKKG